jgi:putative ribosome biogenesis GTPase RsgA
MASRKYDVPYWPLAEAISTGQKWMTIVLEGNIGAGKSTLLNYFIPPELYEVSSIENIFLHSEAHRLVHAH